MKRLYLLDLFRFISVLAIVLFHFFEFTFDQNQIPLPLQKEILVVYLYKIFSYISYSGQSVVAISSFLVGFKKNNMQRFKILLPIFAFGYVLILFGFYDNPMENIFYWDIYPFLLVSLTTLFFLNKSEFLIQLSFFMGIIMFFLPYREISSEAVNMPMKEIIWGICQSEYNTSWPLVPWIGFVWIFNYFGFVAKKYSNWFSKLFKGEWLSYLVFLGFAQISYFGHAPLSDSLYCYISKAQWRETLSYFFIIYLLLRSSVLVELNNLLSHIKIFRWISSSAWSKNFGLAYVLQLAYLGVVSRYDDFYKENPSSFLLAYLLCFVFVELSYLSFVQFINFLNKRNLYISP